MLRAVYLIILFEELNLLASHRTRIVSDVRGYLVWNERVHAWLVAWVGIGNWLVWRLLWI